MNEPWQVPYGSDIRITRASGAARPDLLRAELEAAGLEGGPALGRLPRPARKVLGWPKRCKLAHVFMWEYIYKRLKLAQLLGQLGVFLTCARE